MANISKTNNKLSSSLISNSKEKPIRIIYSIGRKVDNYIEQQFNCALITQL